MTTRRFLLLAALAAAPACAGKQSWESISSEVHVHSLPRGARLSVNGRPAGTAPVSVSIPQGEGAAAELTASREGFATITHALDRGALPGEIVVVLAPVVDGAAQPPPSWTDAAALASAGLALARASRCADAVQFFDRALEVEPRLTDALREGGRCQRTLGNHAAARALLGRYLLALPTAGDAAAVRAELDAMDDARTIDLPGTP